MNENFETINKLSPVISEGGLRTKNILKNSEKDKPLITIITAVLNNKKYLEECLLSLHKQRYDNYEDDES